MDNDDDDNGVFEGTRNWISHAFGIQGMGISARDRLFSWEFLDLFMGGPRWFSSVGAAASAFPRNPSWERRLFTVPHSVLMTNGEEAFSPYD